MGKNKKKKAAVTEDEVADSVEAEGADAESSCGPADHSTIDNPPQHAEEEEEEEEPSEPLPYGGPCWGAICIESSTFNAGKQLSDQEKQAAQLHGVDPQLLQCASLTNLDLAGLQLPHAQLCGLSALKDLQLSHNQFGPRWLGGAAL